MDADIEVEKISSAEAWEESENFMISIFLEKIVDLITG